MSKRFDLSLLSTYRRELMGFSAIGILMCHAYGNNVHLDTPFYQILSLGSLGTPMFFLLSGLGIYYSLNKNKETTFRWIINRLIKLFVPYSVVILPFFIYDAIIRDLSVVDFLLRFSTIGYWMGKGGAWFVAFLVPLYLVSPLWHKIMSKTHYKLLFTLLIIVFMIVLGHLIPSYSVAIHKGMFFFVGYYLATYTMISNKYRISYFWIYVVSGILIIASRVFPSLFYLPWFWPLLFPCMTMVCDICKIPWLHPLKNIQSFMGGICYESYLTNVSLPAVIPAFSLFVGNVDIAGGGYLRYLLIVVTGILLSYYLNKVNKHLLSLIFITSK